MRSFSWVRGNTRRRRAESVASSILAETLSSPETVSNWDVEATDQTSQTLIHRSL
jgi:hypothetical protein